MLRSFCMGIVGLSLLANVGGGQTYAQNSAPQKRKPQTGRYYQPQHVPRKTTKAPAKKPAPSSGNGQVMRSPQRSNSTAKKPSTYARRIPAPTTTRPAQKRVTSPGTIAKKSTVRPNTRSYAGQRGPVPSRTYTNRSLPNGSVNRNGARYSQQGPNGSRQGGYVNRNGGGYQQRGPNGSSQGGYVNRNRGGYQQRNADGSGQGGYVNRNGGGFNQRNSDGSGQSGYANRTGGGYERRSADGSRTGGYVQGGRNGGAGYHNYDPMGNGYGGNVQRGKGGVTVNGQYNQPVPGAPFVQQRNSGQADFRGRDSRFSGNSDYYIGGQRLGGQGQTYTRNQYNNNIDAGPFRYREEAKADFRGKDTRVTYGREYGVNGVGGIGAGATASRHGISAQGSVGAFGYKQNMSAKVDASALKPPTQSRLLSDVLGKSRPNTGNAGKAASKGAGNVVNQTKKAASKVDPGRAVKGTGLPSSKQVFGGGGGGGGFF